MDFGVHYGKQGFLRWGELVGASNGAYPLGRVCFPAIHLAKDLGNEDLCIGPIGIPGCKGFSDLQGETMLLLQDEAHGEVTRC